MDVKTEAARRKTSSIILIILAFYPLVGMSIDLLSPSLPAMGSYFHVSDTTIKNVITFYLFGYALGNFMLGILSDVFGRRTLYILSFVIFTAVSILPLYIQHISFILTARFLQGVAIAGFVVIGRAILADILDKQEIQKVAAYMATMWGIGPIIGPVIGGYLQHYFGWQANFVFFAAYSFLGLLMAFDMPETLEKSKSIDAREIIANFKTILTHKVFIGAIVMMGCTYSILIIFNTLGPFLIQTYFDKTPIYFGHMALLMGIGYLLGTFFCRYLIHLNVLKRFLLPQLIFFSVFAIVFLLLSLYINRIVLLGFFSFAMFFAAGIFYPATMGIALAQFRKMAGTGAAVMNLINILIVSIISLMVNFIDPHSCIPFALLYSGLLILNLAIYLLTLN